MYRIKSLIVVTLLLVTVGASAQLSFGLKAGLNMSSITETSGSEMKIGYKVGPTVEFMFAPSMGIQSGLLLSSQGVKYSGGDSKIDANYLQIPISFVYKYAIAPTTRIYGNAGPYFGYGIFGNSTLIKVIDVDTFGDTGILERFDAGLTMGIGTEVSKFNFGLNYDLGLTDATKLGSGTNSNFWISVGYNF